ncbi:MAG: endonuclease MutS2 [Sporocytophaga sp.]|nr:endonuclease MutS2 [Sporocytophaga sp.]
MNYPDNIETKLGFNQIRELLKQECLSTLGQHYVERIRYSTDASLVSRLLNQTWEFTRILSEQILFPSSNYIDVTPYLQNIRIQGVFLEPSAFFDIKLSLRTIIRCLEFFDENEAYPYLKEQAKSVKADEKIYKAIDEIIDDRGQVRDNASPELLEIRRSLISEQSRIRRELDRLLKLAKREGYTESDVEITIRNGRMVIPVQAEHKRRLKGFIQDESASGQTVFIEPAEVLEGNNVVRELEYRERREIIRILTALTDRIRPFVPDLQKAYAFLGIIDFIRAKAKFGIAINAQLPKISDKPIIKWKSARHPLLFLNLKKSGKTIVPLDIELTEENRILVISGPNAGGKSVCLKSTGLLQYMFQCGLLISADEFSEFGMFQDIFLDIGDEQSIENDLSTYSSHLTNMKAFLNFSGKKSLVLIDEFGTGTEPQLGAAISEAVLERLNEKKVWGVITTHYSNLKTMAEKTPGIVNGAMRFDLDLLEPLYQLEIGRPGSSFAFEIAAKIGLDKATIERSRSKLGRSQVNFERLANELQKEKDLLIKQNQEARGDKQQLDKTLAEYSKLKEELEQNRRRLLNEAKQQAKQLVAEANQKIENTIRAIRSVDADKEITKTLRKELDLYKDIELQPEQVIEKEEPKEETLLLEGEINVGDSIRLKGTDTVGEVLGISGKTAEIVIGDLKSKVKLDRLEKVSRRTVKKQFDEVSRRSTAMLMNEKMMSFSSNLDLRGKRGEEAMKELEEFMDSAIMLGIPEIRIIHGKGDGILRNLVREHLRKYKQIRSVTDEHADRGGPGVSIVGMK